MTAISPTLKYTSLGRSRRVVAMSEPTMPSGTTRMTAAGMDQLSYRAARQRKMASSESASRAGTWAPEVCSSSEVPVHSKPKPGPSWAARRASSSMASPVLVPGAASPLMRMAG